MRIKLSSNVLSSIVALCVGAIVTPAPAQTAAVKPLVTKGACLSCHAVDKKIIGPAYTDVAKKYEGDAGAADRLAEKIIRGGSGVWGQIPMPAASALTPAEAKILATWVLAGAPSK